MKKILLTFIFLLLIIQSVEYAEAAGSGWSELLCEGCWRPNFGYGYCYYRRSAYDDGSCGITYDQPVNTDFKPACPTGYTEGAWAPQHGYVVPTYYPDGNHIGGCNNSSAW